jgi:hypothetical protein
MDAKKPIQQLVNDVLEQLKAQGYTRGAIREYEVSYLKLSAYVDENKIDEYNWTLGRCHPGKRTGS